MSLIRSLVVCLERRALIFTLALGFPLFSSQVNAQSQAAPAQVSSDVNSGGTVAPGNDNAAILRELDAMKQRIVELEAQLKARGGAPADAAAATTRCRVDGRKRAPPAQSGGLHFSADRDQHFVRRAHNHARVDANARPGSHRR